MRGILIIFLFLLTSCWKKDTEEFANLKPAIQSSYSIPIFHYGTTINNSLSFIPSFLVKDSLWTSFPRPADIVGTSDLTVNSIVFKNIIETNLPLILSYQIYLTDSSNKIIDSIFSKQSSIVNSETTTTVYTTLDYDKYQKFQNHSRLLLYYFVKFDNTMVQNSYNLKAEMAVTFSITYRQS